jgi:hypothetical protein
VNATTVVSKGEFARQKQRSPSCITKWIKAGKISRDALVGDGNAAKIWVERADADLAQSLDPAQQAIQQVPVLPTAPPTATAAPDQSKPQPDIPRPSSDRELDLARRAKADADKAEHDAEAARRKLAVDEGRWMDATAASKEWSRGLSEIVAGFEVFLASTLARDTADRNGLDMKAVSVRFREMFRKYRAGVSAAASDQDQVQAAAE